VARSARWIEPTTLRLAPGIFAFTFAVNAGIPSMRPGKTTMTDRPPGPGSGDPARCAAIVRPVEYAANAPRSAASSAGRSSRRRTSAAERMTVGTERI
jgi:hypothetical protein